MNDVVSHALSPVVLILKGLCFRPTMTWHIQHEFSDCSCDTVCIWYNDNFFTRGCSKLESKQFSAFHSLVIGERSLSPAQSRYSPGISTRPSSSAMANGSIGSLQTLTRAYGNNFKSMEEARAYLNKSTIMNGKRVSKAFL